MRTPAEVRPTPTAEDALSTYLTTLFGGAPADGFIETRRRVLRGMACEFFAVYRLGDVAAAVLEAGARSDVYIGVAPRICERGRRDDVPVLRVAWCDCDTTDAMTRLEFFRPSPSMVVRSGHGKHAYWLLEEQATAEAVVGVNRRLSIALGGDPQATDAARILRPPGTFNFKGEKRRPVVLERVSADLVDLDELAAGLPKLGRPPARGRPRIAWPAWGDALRSITPEDYVEALTGQEIGRDGKVHCPFHADRTPSLQVYADHWFCFGCERGGTIIDFGSHLYRLPPRGLDYFEIRRRLAADLRVGKEAV